MTTACRNHILTAFGTQSSPQHALRGWLAPGFSRRSDETARQPCLCSSQHDLILGSSSSTPLDVIMFFLLPTSHLHLVVSFSVSSLYYPCLFFPRIISSLSVVWCSCLLLNCFFFFFFTPFCVLCALAFRVVLFQACFLCASFVFFFLQTSGRLRCLQTIWQNAITIYLFSMRFRRCRWTLAEFLLLPSALRYVDDSGISVGSCLHRLLFALLSRCVHLDS